MGHGAYSANTAQGSGLYPDLCQPKPFAWARACTMLLWELDLFYLRMASLAKGLSMSEVVWAITTPLSLAAILVLTDWPNSALDMR